MVKKIKWKRGMEITPATFEESDRYWECSARELRQLITVSSWGIIPGALKNVSLVLADDKVTIHVINLKGVTKSGEIIDITGDKISLNQPLGKGRECFLTVKHGPDAEQEVNNTSYCVPKYVYDFCTLEEIGDECLAFAKMVRVAENWQIQEVYIPPCLTIAADPDLTGIVSNVANQTNELLGIAASRIDPHEFAIWRMLAYDMVNFQHTDTPIAFYNLLKKIIFVISTASIAGFEAPEIHNIPPFNENDILKSLHEMTLYIDEYSQRLKGSEHKEAPKVVTPQHIEIETWDAEL